jgi:hypothetical protein
MGGYDDLHTAEDVAVAREDLMAWAEKATRPVPGWPLAPEDRRIIAAVVAEEAAAVTGRAVELGLEPA